MGSLFSPDSGFARAVSRVCDLMVLNVLFLICCIPVVTAGGASAALYTVTLGMAEERDGAVVRTFFRALKGSFFRGLAFELIFAAAAALILLGLSEVSAEPETFSWVFNAVYLLAGAVLLLVMSWTWPLEAQFENPVGRTLKNALFLGLAHPLVSLAVIFLNLIPAALALFATYWFLAGSFVWCLFGFSGIAAICSLLFSKVLRPYLKEKKEQQTGLLTEE